MMRRRFNGRNVWGNMACDKSVEFAFLQSDELYKTESMFFFNKCFRSHSHFRSFEVKLHLDMFCIILSLHYLAIIFLVLPLLFDTEWTSYFDEDDYENTVKMPVHGNIHEMYSDSYHMSLIANTHSMGISNYWIN